VRELDTSDTSDVNRRMFVKQTNMSLTKHSISRRTTRICYAQKMDVDVPAASFR
jgi:hypothetical protein